MLKDYLKNEVKVSMGLKEGKLKVEQSRDS